MQEKTSQNSKVVFDGANLQMTSDGPIYNEEKKVSLPEALVRSGGGKRHKDLNSALKEFKKALSFKDK